MKHQTWYYFQGNRANNKVGNVLHYLLVNYYQPFLVQHDITTDSFIIEREREIESP